MTRKLWPAAALVILGCLPATADAFIPYSGVGRGNLHRERNIDNHASDPEDHIVTHSDDIYRARFRYSFRIDGFGNIEGRGDGSYQTATYHLEGTNGDQGAFSCDLQMATTEFAVRVTGHANDGTMHLRFALDGAREANEETLCGADYYAFATDDTRLADSLDFVLPPDGLELSQADPAIAPLTRLETTGDEFDMRVNQHDWRFTIEALDQPPVLPENGVGAYDRPGQAGRRARVCTIEGTGRNDILNGTSGNDVICSYGGRDVVNGRGGHDLVYGGPGRDRIAGGRGLDTLFGNSGRDSLNARDQRRDIVNGGDGNDRARVDRGRDRVRKVEQVG